MRVKYIGPRSRVLAGKHILQGEIRDLPDKQALLLQGDPDFEFPDEVQEAPEAPALFEVPNEAEEPAAPQPTVVFTETFNASGEDLQELIELKPAQTRRTTTRKPRKK